METARSYAFEAAPLRIAPAGARGTAVAAAVAESEAIRLAHPSTATGSATLRSAS